MDLVNNYQLSNKQHFWLFFTLLIFMSTAMVVAYNPHEDLGHDYFFHMLRFEALIEALRDGTFPYYIDNNAINGYGYLSKAFYCDIILIPFAAIGLFSSIEFAYNAMLFVMTVLCGVFTFYAVKQIFKNNTAASISSILYTFCYYRIIDTYHRAALGETLSFTFLPIIYLGLYHIIKGDYKKWYIIAIGYALMIFTHLLSSVLTAFVTVIFLIIYNKLLRKEPVRLIYLGVAAIVTILLTTYYWLPMIEQMLSNSFYYQTREYINLLANRMIFSAVIWSLFSGPIQAVQGFIPAIGITLTACVCLRLFVYNKTKLLKHADQMVILGVFFIFVSSFLFPWQYFPFTKFHFIQFPWRFYEFVSFFFAIAGAYYSTFIIKGRKRQLIGYGLLLLLILFTFKSDKYVVKETSLWLDYKGVSINDNRLHLSGAEYLPSAVPSTEFLFERDNTKIITENNSTVSNFAKERGGIEFYLSLGSANDKAELPLTYYKGYKATIDGQEIPYTQSLNGLIELGLSQSGHIKVSYVGTTLQAFAFYFSIICFILLSVYLIINQRKKNA